MAGNDAWRKIAEEVSTERDSDKVVELTQELIKALDEEAARRTQRGAQGDEEKTRRKAA
ncbi:MAG TPA: hypothetical protein VJS37_00775 [Terriglobales bacterium]|nr:hypothetical protein [Terriglobales bacterium]